ncbi:MAG: D-aminoacyl-tRNA deacylase [Oscillospiraceae bacterium]|nr:D-aminoacyl-tRNA deacylase [Oscillospiraceae bacterium]
MSGIKAVVTRVKSAGVEVVGRGGPKTEIGKGLLVLAGVAKDDAERDAVWMADRVCKLRVFEDAAGKMNVSPRDAGASLLIVSNFTLCGDCAASRRPDFAEAAGGDAARVLFDRFVLACRDSGLPVHTGVFGAEMAVWSVNDGPVTFVLDSGQARAKLHGAQKG